MLLAESSTDLKQLLVKWKNLPKQDSSSTWRRKIMNAEERYSFNADNEEIENSGKFCIPCVNHQSVPKRVKILQNNRGEAISIISLSLFPPVGMLWMELYSWKAAAMEINSGTNHYVESIFSYLEFFIKI